MRVVAAIIEKEEGLVLLAERPPGKRLAGYWEFPGGKVEAGETPQEALIRELKEELHLDVLIDRDLGEFEYVYEWGAIQLHVFVVHPQGVPRSTKDVQVFHWVSVKSVGDYALAPADVEPWNHYLSGLKSATV